MMWYPMSQKTVTELETTCSVCKLESAFKIGQDIQRSQPYHSFACTENCSLFIYIAGSFI